jgi:hypothetical protein
MRHDPSLARQASRAATRSLARPLALLLLIGSGRSADALVAAIGLRASLVALILVPGRWLLAMAWPS